MVAAIRGSDLAVARDPPSIAGNRHLSLTVTPSRASTRTPTPAGDLNPARRRAFIHPVVVRPDCVPVGQSGRAMTAARSPAEEGTPAHVVPAPTAAQRPRDPTRRGHQHPALAPRRRRRHRPPTRRRRPLPQPAMHPPHRALPRIHPRPASPPRHTTGPTGAGATTARGTGARTSHGAHGTPRHFTGWFTAPARAATRHLNAALTALPRRRPGATLTAA